MTVQIYLTHIWYQMHDSLIFNFYPKSFWLTASAAKSLSHLRTVNALIVTADLMILENVNPFQNMSCVPYIVNYSLREAHACIIHNTVTLQDNQSSSLLTWLYKIIKKEIGLADETNLEKVVILWRDLSATNVTHPYITWARSSRLSMRRCI